MFRDVVHVSALSSLNKLRKMSIHEIQDRVRDRLRVRQERRIHAAGERSRISSKIVEETASQLCERHRQILPGCQDQHLERIAENWPTFSQTIADNAIHRADAILNGTCKLLGATVQTSFPMDWHTDPISGHHWERQFYTDVPIYELSNGADVKYVWEINRHQYFVDLARGWRLTGREDYVSRLRDLMLSWIGDNPLYEGVNWTSGLEVAVRSISWMWSLAMSSGWSGWRQSEIEIIARSMIQHATYLDDHFSYYSSPYNHLIGEATGLYLLSHVLGTHPDSRRWRERAHTALETHGPRQFYDDGFCAEQATGYHFFTLGFLSQAVVVARSTGDALPSIEKSLPDAFRAGAALIQPDGRWPIIGDVDSARSIPVGNDDFWDFRSLLSIGAVLFEIPELKQPSTEPGEELFWLCGVEGLDAWASLAATRAAATAYLPSSGYAVARSEDGLGDDWILFDAGPLGDGVYQDSTPSVSHGHCDALSIMYHHSGRSVLVDSGTPTYAGPRSWVDHFRDASAHNTIAIDGLPAAQQPGRLAWSHVHPCPEFDANLSSDIWLARGKLQLDKNSCVTRWILGLPGHGLWIADLVELDRPRQIHWYWHTADEPLPFREELGDTCYSWSVGKTVLGVDADGTTLETVVEASSDESPIAWRSQGYGERTPGHRIKLSTKSVDRVFAVTFLGTKTLPHAVRSGSDQVVSHLRIPERPIPPADIVWHVEIDGQVETIVAGVDCTQAPNDWRTLTGVGNWTAATTLGATSVTNANEDKSCTSALH